MLIISNRYCPMHSSDFEITYEITPLIEGYRANRENIAFRADFYFCRIELNVCRLTCVDMKSIIV